MLGNGQQLRTIVPRIFSITLWRWGLQIRVVQPIAAEQSALLESPAERPARKLPGEDKGTGSCKD